MIREMGRDNRSQEESGKKKKYIPPRFAHLPPSKRERCWPREACRTARSVRELLEWVAELEKRPAKK